MSIISLINNIPLGNPAEKGYFLYKKTPQALLDKMAADNFRATIKWVYEKSPFYRDAFLKRGIDPSKIQKPADLGDFFTTAEDIRKNPDAFLCQKPDTAFETTGTTSARTKRVYFSRNELAEAGWSGAVGLWGLGVRPEDRVSSAFDYSFWVSGPILSASCAVIGCFHVEAGRMDPAEFYDRLKDYKLTVIVGDPSWIVRLSEIAKAKGAWPVKLLIGGGENMTEEARAFVESVWKAPFIISYGQTEALGSIGIESLAKDGYHLNEFHNAFEIIHADADGFGELVYTNLNRRVMPLVRYRSGDITRFLTGESRSGLPGRRIQKLKGRVDEWVATAMGNVAPWIFEPFFSKLTGAGADWQVELGRSGNKDLITFHVERANGGEAAPMKEEFLAKFKAAFPDFWKFYELGLYQIDFRSHTAGSLRTGRKLRRVLDNRKF